MKYSLILPLLFFAFSLFAQLKSPDEFLPHKLGEHFTPHHYLVEYYQHIAEQSPLVEVEQYGVTNLNKPLIVAYVSSEENITNLENIRRYNLKQAGIENNDIQLNRDITIVWLSFSVHGNEAAGSESSYQVLFELADPENARTKPWLQNTVVVLDPSVNPDGYERYTHWVRNFSGYRVNTDPEDIEHNEPWPGGRTNFYFFDLNRDWAWQTQAESKHRMALYNRWLPHVHADLHEMGYTSPYYFAPAAEPYHQYITQWQRDFQFDIGRNHAKYFDENGWLFFTREVFDLFYPSYGDTYPVYSGAIGMTYEQGGGGTGGRSIELPNGEYLTLTDRIAHHKTAALSTIEISSKNAAALAENFQQYFEESHNDPPGEYKSYVIKGDPSNQRIRDLAQLLDLQGIKYGTVQKISSKRGYAYQSGEQAEFNLQPGDLIVNARQPKAVLTQVLLDPESELSDSLTYDITAWSLPYAYGLEAYALREEIANTPELTFSIRQKDLNPSAVAYAFHWGGLNQAKTLAKIMECGLSTRVLLEDMVNSGHDLKAGTIVITKSDNQTGFTNLGEAIGDCLINVDIEILALTTGFSVEGPDLGSRSLSHLPQAKVLVIMGDNVRSNDYGQVKYFFEQNLGMNITSVTIEDLGRLNMNDYTTLVLPSGRYSFSDAQSDEIRSWVRQGGKLILLEYALSAFADREGFALKRYATDEEKSEAEKAEEEESLVARLDSYEGEARRRISEDVPGALIKVEMDQSNPLAYGIDQDYFTLKTNAQVYSLIKGVWNVAYIPEDLEIRGFVGVKIREELKNTVVFGVEEQGLGAIVYMVDNPLFRGFWNIGQVLFANAVFFGGE